MNRFKFVQDIFFYITIAILFMALFILIVLFYLPYYLGRAIWIRIEDWQIKGERWWILKKQKPSGKKNYLMNLTGALENAGSLKNGRWC